MYNDLLTIYRKTNITIFTCAVTYLADKGRENVKQLTDKDISEVKGNTLMTADYIQAIMRTARDISNVVQSGVEVIQFCNAESVFETVFYTKGEHLDRWCLERALSRAVNGIEYGDLFEIANDKYDLADYLGVDEDDLKVIERGWE